MSNSSPDRAPEKVPKAAKKRPGRYHHGDLRNALVQAALELIRNEGEGALTLRRVAKNVGVTHAAPYRHFANKAELLAAVAQSGFETMTAQLRQQIVGVDDPVRAFETLGVAYVEFSLQHPGYFRVMFSREIAEKPVDAYPNLAEAKRETFGLLLNAVRQCQGAGLIGGDGPQKPALAAWSTVHGLSSLLANHSIPGPAPEPAQLAHMVSRALYDGLAIR